MPFSQHDWAIAEMHRLLTSTRKMLDADVIKASVRRSSMLLRAADVLSNVMQDPRIPESLRAYLSDKIRDDAPKDAAATARVVAWLDANAHELNKCKSDLARLTAVTQAVGPSLDEEAMVDTELVAACRVELKRTRRLLASAYAREEARKRGAIGNGKRPRPSFTAPPRCRRLVVVPPRLVPPPPPRLVPPPPPESKMAGDFENFTPCLGPWHPTTATWSEPEWWSTVRSTAPPTSEESTTGNPFAMSSDASQFGSSTPIGSDFGKLPSIAGSSSTNIGSSQWTPTSPAGSTNPSVSPFPSHAGGNDEPTLPDNIRVKLLADGRQGTIAEVDGASYGIEVEPGEPLIKVRREEIEVVRPAKKDRLVIIKGELRGHTGTLIGVDDPDGIVKMTTNSEIKILDLKSCAKLADVLG